jgi:hypothetical protein
LKQWLLLKGVDVVIATYPKTGSTWFQLMIRTLLSDHYQLGPDATGRVFVDSLLTTYRLPEDVPRVYITHGMPGFNEDRHQAMFVESRRFSGKRVILLVREPKDTMVSLYFHNRHRTVPPVYTGEIDAMVYDDVYGIGKYIKYYQVWQRDRHRFKDLLLVKYEDLKADPAQELRRTASFIGIKDASDVAIQRAVDACSFENMKKAEAAGSGHVPGLNRSKNPSAEAFKVREGVVGGYRSHLGDAAIQHIDRCVREQLPGLYGYPIVDARLRADPHD